MQHLLHKSQFDAVLGTRNHLVQVLRTEHFFMHRLEITSAHQTLFASPTTNVFIGAMLPKRFAKRAVTRNLIKRQIYVLAREHPLTAGAYVVRLKAIWNPSQYPSASSMALKRAVRSELMSLFSALHSPTSHHST